VDDHPRGLVDDQEIAVLVDHRQRQRLGLRLQRRRLDQAELDRHRRVALEAKRRLERGAVGPADEPGVEGPTQLRARTRKAALGERLDQGEVEAATQRGPFEEDPENRRSDRSERARIVAAVLRRSVGAYQIEVFSEAIGLMTRSTIARS
jgi:hypothetical protein